MATKYDRVAANLRQRITSGAYEAGQRLPTETEFMSQFGMSLSTIRRALDVLEVEGLVERQHGTGTFVRHQPLKMRRTTDRYQWEKDRISIPEDERRRMGTTEYESGSTVEDFVFHAEYERTVADEELALVFDIEPGEPLLRRVYRTINRNERAPLSLGESFLVIDRIKANPALLDSSNEPWPGGTQHQLSTVGIEISRIRDIVSARPATEDEAEELDRRPGAALLCIRKISYDMEGRVVEVADTFWPGDRIDATYDTHLKSAGTK